MRTTRRRIGWLNVVAVVCMAGLTACGSKKVESVEAKDLSSSKNSADNIEITINGDPIHVDQLANTVRRLSLNRNLANAQARTQVVLQAMDYEIMRELWRQDMVKAGNPITAQEADEAQEKFISLLPRRQSLEDVLAKEGLAPDEFRENTVLNLYRERFIREHTENLPEITNEEIEAYFQEFIKTTDVPDSVNARQIFIETQASGKLPKEERAQEAWQHLKDGRDFAEVAWLYSDHVSRADEGRIGRVWRGTTQNSRLESALFALHSGEFSDVIKEGENYYILQVDEFFPKKSYPREEVDAQIRTVMTETARQRFLRNYQVEMVQKANIQFFGNLKSMEKTYWRIYFPELQPTHSAQANEKSE